MLSLQVPERGNSLGLPLIDGPDIILVLDIRQCVSIKPNCLHTDPSFSDEADQ